MQETSRLFIWGKGYPAIKELKKNVITVGVGENHFIYLTSSRKFIVGANEVFDVGSNKFGQLGLA